MRCIICKFNFKFLAKFQKSRRLYEKRTRRAPEAIHWRRRQKLQANGINVRKNVYLLSYYTRRHTDLERRRGVLGGYI